MQPKKKLKTAAAGTTESRREAARVVVRKRWKEWDMALQPKPPPGTDATPSRTSGVLKSGATAQLAAIAETGTWEVYAFRVEHDGQVVADALLIDEGTRPYLRVVVEEEKEETSTSLEFLDAPAGNYTSFLAELVKPKLKPGLSKEEEEEEKDRALRHWGFQERPNSYNLARERTMCDLSENCDTDPHDPWGEPEGGDRFPMCWELLPQVVDEELSDGPSLSSQCGASPGDLCLLVDGAVGDPHGGGPGIVFIARRAWKRASSGAPPMPPAPGKQEKIFHTAASQIAQLKYSQLNYSDL